MLMDVMTDDGAGVNMMTNPAMGYIGLAVEISLSITLKMTNKIIYKYLCIECMYQCFWDFRGHGFSCDIRRWKIKSNDIRLAVVYQSTLSKLIGWMIYDNQEIRKIKLFVPPRGTPTSDESDSDLLEVDNSKLKGIYTYDSSDNEVRLYVI